MDREAAAIRAASRDMGYSALKPQQEIIVRHVLSGRDVFVSLPTGDFAPLFSFRDIPTKKARSCSDRPRRHVTAALKLIGTSCVEHRRSALYKR